MCNCFNCESYPQTSQIVANLASWDQCGRLLINLIPQFSVLKGLWRFMTRIRPVGSFWYQQQGYQTIFGGWELAHSMQPSPKPNSDNEKGTLWGLSTAWIHLFWFVTQLSFPCTEVTLAPTQLTLITWVTNCSSDNLVQALFCFTFLYLQHQNRYKTKTLLPHRCC